MIKNASACAVVWLALAGMAVSSLEAEPPDDPFFPEPPSAVAENYPAYQWALGAHFTDPRVDINILPAWDLLDGHAYLGAMDAGIAEFGWLTMPTRVDLGPLHEDLIENFRQHLSPSFGDALRAAESPGLNVGIGPFGHGMHVMGIMTGESDNDQGISGVCRSCSALLINNGILNQASYKNGLEDLVRSGVQAINMSFGWNTDTTMEHEAGFAIKIENIAAQRDVVLVAAAGNDRFEDEIDFPAEHPQVIGVGGSDPGGLRWDDSDDCVQRPIGTPIECGSNTGPALSVVAPAKHVLSAWYPNDVLAGDNRDQCGDRMHAPGSAEIPGPVHPDAAIDDGYGLCTGTSMSAPLVTGVVGLIRSANPHISSPDVRAIVESTARNPAAATDIGYGVIDAEAAVREALGEVAGETLKTRLTPLFVLYSAIGKDHLLTTVPQMASSAINSDPRRRYPPASQGVPATLAPYTSGDGVAGVSTESLELYPAFPGGAAAIPRAWAFIFTTDYDPLAEKRQLVPLYRMSMIDTRAGNNANRDHVYTSEKSELAFFALQGYQLDGIEGYVYPRTSPQPAATVKLIRRFNAARHDHILAPEDLENDVESEGYSSIVNGRDFIGYAYRNVDSDLDGAIDGFETLISTDPFLFDTDADGLSDGEEIVLYPYSNPRSDLCSVIFSDDFDSGDIQAWTDSKLSGAATLQATMPSAQSSGLFGLASRVQSLNAQAYVIDRSPNAESKYSAAFDLKIGQALMPDPAVHRIFAGVDSAVPNLFVLVVDYRRYGDEFQIRARALQDNGVWASSPFETIGFLAEKQHLSYRVEVAIDALAGMLRFRVGNVEHVVSGLSLTTRHIEEVRLGQVNSVDDVADSNLFFDSFESCRD